METRGSGKPQDPSNPLRNNHNRRLSENEIFFSRSSLRLGGEGGNYNHRNTRKYFEDYNCKKENVSVEALKSGSRRQKVSAIRSQLARKLVEEWGISLTEAGRRLGVSPSAIAKTLYRLDSHKSN